jgi:hypothetical protein
MVGKDRGRAMSRTLPLLSELLAPMGSDELDDQLAAFRVRLILELPAGVDPLTQAFVATLAGLVVRSGMTLQVDVLSGPTLVSLLGLAAPRFDAALDVLVSSIFPGASLDRGAVPPDVAVVLGLATSPMGPRSTIRLATRGRRARLDWGNGPAQEWRPANELVALAAAGLAAMELHKAALRTMSARNATAAALLAPSSLEFEVPFDLPPEISLGRVDAISAGAISQNAFWTFAAVNRLSADLRVFDRDEVELSNANRCPFVLLDRIGQPKVKLLADLVPNRLLIEPVYRHFRADDVRGTPLAPIVLVGADDIAVRHWVQAARPEFLIIGATSHFEIVVSEHLAGTPCAGCVHPRVDGVAPALIPTVSFVSFWAGYLCAVRAIARALGQPYVADRQLTVAFPLQLEGSWTGPTSFREDCPVGHRRVA